MPQLRFRCLLYSLKFSFIWLPLKSFIKRRKDFKMKRKYILYNCINKILNHFFCVLYTGSEYINFGMWVRSKNLQHPLALNKTYEEAQILEMIEAKMLVAKFYKVLEFRIFFPCLTHDAREDFPKSIYVKVNATQLAILHGYATPQHLPFHLPSLT